MALTPEEIGELLFPYSGDGLSRESLGLFQTYLTLILKWNAKFNLTSLRAPAEIATRHFGEGVFAARFVPAGARTVMDLGSGLGIPGIPMQIMRPDLAVSLVESNRKKASFLLEAARQLRLRSTVLAKRAEEVENKFDVVALRAVEKMEEMLAVATGCMEKDGVLMVLATQSIPAVRLRGIDWEEYPLPNAIHSVLRVGRSSQSGEAANVPRGTSSI